MGRKSTGEKKGFMDVYKTYDVKKEGYGSPDEWQAAFNQRFTIEEAEEILNEDSPWTILGVKMGASAAEIKAAFRTLIMKHHPDKNPNNVKEAEEMSKKIIAAYSILRKD